MSAHRNNKNTGIVLEEVDPKVFEQVLPNIYEQSTDQAKLYTWRKYIVLLDNFEGMIRIVVFNPDRNPELNIVARIVRILAPEDVVMAIVIPPRNIVESTKNTVVAIQITTPDNKDKK